MGGKYLGTHILVDGLRRDTFTCMYASQKLKMSRWMMLHVDQEKRSTALDEKMQHFETHGAATIKVGPSFSVVPSEDWDEKTPIIAVRRYEVSAAIIHLAYYYHYGSHRCNLALDGDLGEAVYCYTDIDTLLNKLDYTKEDDRITVIGVVSGFFA